MSTIRQRVAEAAITAVKNAPSGLRWAELYRAVQKVMPEENGRTLAGSLHHFAKNLPPGIHRPERGLYVAGNPSDEDTAEPVRTRFREQDFYQPFADWLVGDLEEASRAVAAGGSAAGGKWGTPDVIGLYQPRKTDPIRFVEEVVVAEIKVDTSSLIVAFGQACAYKLFAHRVYIVVPRTANAKDLKRLDALAGVVGIGLVKFDPTDPQNPDFSVLVRAAKHEPDYFYTNDFLSHYKSELDL